MANVVMLIFDIVRLDRRFWQLRARALGMNRLVPSTIALLLGLLCVPIWAVSAYAERRVALVIGNSAYQNAPALPNPVRDAKAVAAMFVKAGYDVVGAYDVGNLDFKRAIRQFENTVADADVAVIYYAGHGIQIHGTNFLIPVDAWLKSDRDADDQAVTLERLMESADEAKRFHLIVLDASRDNPFARTMKVQQSGALRGINSGLGPAEPSGTNTLIAYAARVGQSAEDGSGSHSPFTTALLNNLFVPGLDIRLAFGRVRDEVLKMTDNRQEPYVYGSLGAGNVALVDSVNDLKPDRVALIIGNAAYPNADAPLREPVSDARDLGAQLHDQGFDVAVAENLSKEAMRQALDGFYGKLKSAATGLIFFSGFGIQAGRQNYLIPVDAQIWNESDVRREGFSLDKILSDMTDKGASAKLAIIDASRHNPYERNFRSAPAGLAAITAPKGAAVMMSTPSDTVTADGTAAVFVPDLIRELKVTGATIEQVLNRTRMDVSRDTKGQQVPSFSSSLTEDIGFDSGSGHYFTVDTGDATPLPKQTAQSTPRITESAPTGPPNIMLWWWPQWR